MFRTRNILEEKALKASQFDCALDMSAFIAKNPVIESLPIMTEFKRQFKQREADLESNTYKYERHSPKGFTDKLLKYFNLPASSSKYWTGKPEWTTAVAVALDDLISYLQNLDENSVCVEFVFSVKAYYGDAILKEVKIDNMDDTLKEVKIQN